MYFFKWIEVQSFFFVPVLHVLWRQKPASQYIQLFKETAHRFVINCIPRRDVSAGEKTSRNKFGLHHWARFLRLSHRHQIHRNLRQSYRNTSHPCSRLFLSLFQNRKIKSHSSTSASPLRGGLDHLHPLSLRFEKKRTFTRGQQRK